MKSHSILFGYSYYKNTTYQNNGRRRIWINWTVKTGCIVPANTIHSTSARYSPSIVSMYRVCWDPTNMPDGRPISFVLTVSLTAIRENNTVDSGSEFWHILMKSRPRKHATLNEWWLNIWPASQTVYEHYPALAQRLVLAEKVSPLMRLCYNLETHQHFFLLFDFSIFISD